MRAKVVVALLVGALLVYLAIVGYQGLLLLGTGRPVGVVLGMAILALPLLGGYVTWREVQFGAASERLAERLSAAGRWPTEVLPTRPSGRPDRAAADSVFARRREEVELDPDDWAAWYRLGLAYEDAGDRRRARQAVRRAITLADEGTPDTPDR
jgi:hypothetical protein